MVKETVRVWNLTDDPARTKKPYTIVLFGRSLEPGYSVVVPKNEYNPLEKRLAQIEGIYVGDKAPEDYKIQKGQVRPKAKGERTHGPFFHARMAEKSESVKEEPKAPEPKKDVIEPQPQVEESTDPSEEELEEMTRPEPEKKSSTRRGRSGR